MKRTDIGRRRLLQVLTQGVAASTISALNIESAAAAPESDSEKRKARFKANSPEVQNFYRVNRYPKR